MSTYIRISQLASRPGQPGRLPIGRTTVWRWCKEGRFPAPVKLSRGVSAWKLEEVEAFIAAQAATTAPQTQNAP